MSNVKFVSQIILVTTIISVVLLLGMKFVEIQKDYPRKNFCVTCPLLPIRSIPRTIEIQVNFNLLILADFLMMMMIILIFGMERYDQYPTYLFAFHIFRLIFNVTTFVTTGVFYKVLKPMVNEFCGLGGQCSNEKVLPHTLVGIFYIVYFAVVVANCIVCSMLMFLCPPTPRVRVAPVITRVTTHTRRNRSVRREPLESSHDTPPPPYSSNDRSPSPPRMMTVLVPPIKQPKYHRLPTSDSFSFWPTKNKVMPVDLPHIRPQLVT
uniref:G_PROTEIN_RECEP_F1_2 domain-containing protein n=1 Tax=Caenorhabditis tropicalis TaxID=1561998 RepID=A0A1I7TWG1_9PELO